MYGYSECYNGDEDVDVSMLMCSVAKRKKVISVMDPDRPTLKQALHPDNPDRQKWIEAMAIERKVRVDRNQFIPLPDGFQIPEGMKPVPTKYILERKKDGRYKARLVAVGSPWNDSWRGESYAPTASKIVLWLVMAVAVLLNMVEEEYDIANAYADTPTKREQYVIFDGKPHRLRLCMNGMADAGVNIT